MQETLVRFLGQEDPLEKGKATHSSILAELDTTQRLSLSLFPKNESQKHYVFKEAGHEKSHIKEFH